MRVAVDMDEVLADTHAGKLALFREMFGYDWSEDEMRGHRPADLADPAHAAAVEAEMQAGAFFGGLDVIEGAVEGLALIAAEHDVFIATAALEYPASCAHKIAWMQRHFPFIDPMHIVLCGHKRIVAADVLIDDSPRHFETFSGTGVLFSAPHNAGHGHPVRLDRWADAPALLDTLRYKGDAA